MIKPKTTQLPSDEEILNKYFPNITKLPILILSPLRSEKKPSFGLYQYGNTILYHDLATGAKGNLISLLSEIWHVSYREAALKIAKNFAEDGITIKKGTSHHHIKHNDVELQIKIRDWKDYDIEYWQSFGISKEWCQTANIFPVSHVLITKDNNTITYIADKYAYAFVECKEGIVSYKIYQPFNTTGFKWRNNQRDNVISLWTKIPKTGDQLIICSAVKDALCLWANVDIPCIAPSSEGASLSQTVIDDLKSRFKQVYILFDNDEAGIRYGIQLARETNFKNLVLPRVNEAKDVSDLYKSLKDKNEFKTIIKKLIYENT